ncbi:MAG TPA: OmpH family outer membrane protein [Candidatus Eisenbacteria bacterium]|nr:OmpH family outer membrane protein [Candidatus Eisenbacteria bacterium]
MWAVTGAIVALFAGAPSVRADIKIGFIDSDRIFAEYPKTREAQESFNREVQELSKTAKEKKTEIDELQRKLDQQGPMLSEAKKDEQNREIQRKLSEYETFVQTNWGPGGRISKLNEEFLKPIVDRVHAIVAEFGTEEGYSLILDAADGNVVFGDKALDLTDRVLLALRQEDEGTRRTTPKSTQGSGTNQNSGNQGQQ